MKVSNGKYNISLQIKKKREQWRWRKCDKYFGRSIRWWQQIKSKTEIEDECECSVKVGWAKCESKERVVWCESNKNIRFV